MFRQRVPQMQQAPPGMIQPPIQSPPSQIMPTQRVEVVEREKTLYDKTIANKKKLNQLKDYLPKAKFNKLWTKVSTDPFFDFDEDVMKANKKSPKSDDDDNVISQQKAYIKQLERLIRKLQK